MKIKIRVIPNSKKDEVKLEDNLLKIKIKMRAEKGKANKYLMKLFSKIGVDMKIIKGEKSKEKIIEVDCELKELKKRIQNL